MDSFNNDFTCSCFQKIKKIFFKCIFSSHCHPLTKINKHTNIKPKQAKILNDCGSVKKKIYR